MYKQSTSLNIKLTLVPLLAGMWITTVSDVEVNTVGLMYAAAAVTFTVFSQIFTSKFQKSLECDALQVGGQDGGAGGGFVVDGPTSPTLRRA